MLWNMPKYMELADASLFCINADVIRAVGNK
jgi:hypothetical protein